MAPLKVSTFGANASEPHEVTVIDDHSVTPTEDDDSLIRGQRIKPAGESSRTLTPEEIEIRRAAASMKAQVAASAPDAPGNRRRRASPTAGLLKPAAPAPKAPAPAVHIDVTSDIAMRARCLEMAAAGGLSDPRVVISTAREYLDFIMGTEEDADVE